MTENLNMFVFNMNGFVEDVSQNGQKRDTWKPKCKDVPFVILAFHIDPPVGFMEAPTKRIVLIISETAASYKEEIFQCLGWF